MLEWEQITWVNIAKTYQQAVSLVDTVYTEVMRWLHYLRATVFLETHPRGIHKSNPFKLALQLVLSFDILLHEKLASYLLRMYTNLFSWFHDTSYPRRQ